MPPTYALPPSTRAVGTVNPAGDMDAVVSVIGSRCQNVFWLNDYGADPTGAALSDTAWTNCYTDAAAAVQAHAGSMIVMGAGYYKFTPGTVAITDSRIGLRGMGRFATTLYTTGSTGSLVKVSGVSAGGSATSAPCGGFAVYGWAAGAGVKGLEYGDRYGGTLTDVTVTGFGGAGSMGFWFRDTTSLSEGSFIAVIADQNADDFVFDAGGGSGSFDYSHIILKVVSTTQGGQSGTAFKMINNMHCNGGFIHLSGNASATAGLTKTVVQVGVNASDTCHIQGTTFIIGVEADTSAGTVKDVLIQGASANAGIVHCNGNMFFQNTSGTYATGTVTSPAVFTTAGFLLGPTFSNHGTLTAIGTGGAFSTYSG